MTWNAADSWRGDGGDPEASGRKLLSDQRVRLGGTCRPSMRSFRHAADAVLDADCRMFEHPNVFVMDGSFMPTSLGVGPALTIIANALRVARIVREI